MSPIKNFADNSHSALFVQESEESRIEELSGSFRQLAIAEDESYYAPPESSSESCSDGSSDDEPSSVLERFLEASGSPPLGKSWLPWDKASERTRGRYIARAEHAVAAVLTAISEENAGHLWKALQTSQEMNRKLGVQGPLPPRELAYLQALAELYKNASG